MKDLYSVHVIPSADTTLLHILHTQADNKWHNLLSSSCCIPPSLPCSCVKKIQREGQSARKVRQICGIKRYHGTGGRAICWLNMRLSKEESLKMVSRTEKIMRRDTYKHEELKKKINNSFYKRREGLLLTNPASNPKYTTILYLRHLTHKRPTVTASLPVPFLREFHYGIIWVWFTKPLP